MLRGYRTYISIGVSMLAGLANEFGGAEVDIPLVTSEVIEGNFATAIQLVSLLLAAYFRSKA